MTSNIDPNVPAAGSEMRSAPLRANFRAAFEEITALQGGSSGGGVHSGSSTQLGRENQISPNAASYTVIGQRNVVGLETNNWGGSRSVAHAAVVGADNILAGGSESGTNYYNLIVGFENDLGPASDGGQYREVRRNIVLGWQNRFGDPWDACASPRLMDNLVIGHSNYRIARDSSRYQYSHRSICIGWDNYLYASASIYDDIIIGYGNQYYGGYLDGGCITIGTWAPVHHHSAWIGGNNITAISFGDGTGTMFEDWSDPRLKDNIAPADVNRCLTDINRLKVSRFAYKDFVASSAHDKHRTGFISADFGQVFPKSVSRDKTYAHGGKWNDKDHRMDGQQVIENCEAIDQSQIIPTLVGAIQALSAMMGAGGQVQRRR